MSKKPQEPKRDFGFYATVPRIVRIKYKDLSHAEKWLYVCLKDLCGDKGTCFRTLRSLSEETDISTGSLSKMIPNLHKAGVIHAEKKRRTESGKEVWHITITDIWAENAKVCSKSEQSSEVVQNLNNVVQNLNENPGDCSKSERDCSFFVDRRKNTEARTNIEERTREESVVPTSAEELPTSPQPEASSLSLSLKKNDSSFSSSPEEKPTEAKPTPVDYALFDKLCRNKGYAVDFRVPRNEKNNAAIKELREQGATAEQVEFVFNDIWEDKDSFWQQHRGKPSTVASQFTARVWKMTQPAQKRRTASGFTNWTEDKSVGVPAIVEPVALKPASVPEVKPVSTPEARPATVPARPKEPALPVGYTRLKLDKPARPRTAYGRRLQAEQEAHSV